ncbi:MAG: S8 family peptidase [Bacteroidales bacterium]|nr:S8 family peptidase [Bacteroidales bacterium]
MKQLIAFVLIVFTLSVFAQGEKKKASDFSQINTNWGHKDIKNDKIVGVSSEKLYREIIKDQPAKKKIIVAIIDSGVDIEHEDLQGQIWVNEDEIPNNGIDDDNNGYIDDVHGWNFIGSKDGKSLNMTTMEATRYYAQLKSRKAQGEAFDEDTEVLYQKLEKEYEYESNKYKEEYKQLNNFVSNYLFSDSVVKAYLKVDSLTYKNVMGASSINQVVQRSIEFQQRLLKNNFDRASLMGYYDHVKEQVEYRYNLDFNPRRDIVGDNLDDILDVDYGNNDVKGPRADHGTMVAGLIGAVRNNEIGIDGIANNIEFMVIRTVPDGDEYDKDVALAIRYAADNGANVINMSFGKPYSPHKEWVWEALRYAESKNVLMIKAAGNENVDIDVDVHFPTAFTDKEKVGSIITVGASDMKNNKKLKAKFSNYGQQGVDVFAPGVDLVSTYPESLYKMASGTSFSSPVVAGVAALIWSYFPELTAEEMKEVIVTSATDYSKRKVVISGKGKEKDKKVKFGTLSQTGGVVNAYDAFLMAQKMVQDKQ